MLWQTAPHLAELSCQTCGRFLVELSTGQRVTRAGQPVPRPANVPTPCWQCPKRSPREAKDWELTPKNHRCWLLFLETRAENGSALPAAWLQDAVLRRNLAIVQAAGRAAKQQPRISK